MASKPKRLDDICPSEDEEQAMIFQWAEYIQNIHPEIALLYAVPNGGKRPISTARRLKATGTKPGVPDLCLPVARGGYHGLYIEMKRVRGGKLSVDQELWIQALNAQGYYATVCAGGRMAIDCLSQYIKGNIKLQERSKTE